MRNTVGSRAAPAAHGGYPDHAGGHAGGWRRVRGVGVTGKLARDDVQPGEWDEVLRGLPHNSTTEMDLELWALATRIRADAAAAAALRGATPTALAHRFTSRDLPPLLQGGLAEFLGRHGHRAVAEIDVGMPRWSDDPTYFLGVLANYLRMEDPDLTPDAQFARGGRDAGSQPGPAP